MDDKSIRKFLELHRKMKSTNLIFISSKFVSSEIITLLELAHLVREQESRNQARELECCDVSVDVGVSMNIIARRLEVTPAMISKTIRNLEKRNIVERYVDPKDRRVIRVSFTENGLVLFNKTRDHFKEFIYDCFEKMGDEDTLQLISLGEKMMKIMEEKSHEYREKTIAKGE